MICNEKNTWIMGNLIQKNEIELRGWVLSIKSMVNKTWKLEIVITTNIIKPV